MPPSDCVRRRAVAGLLEYEELNKAFRSGSKVELDATLKAGAAGAIETKALNKSSASKSPKKGGKGKRGQFSLRGAKGSLSKRGGQSQRGVQQEEGDAGGEALDTVDEADDEGDGEDGAVGE